MRKRTVFLALFFLCSVLQSCNFLPQGEMKIDPETRQPTNRRHGITLDEADDLDASNSSHADLMNGSTTMGPQELGTDSDPNIKDGSEVDESLGKPPLIDEKGRMLGHFVNMSNKAVGLKIYRIRSKLLTTTYKKVYGKQVGKMRDFSYYLSKGSYRATLVVDGMQHCWDFEVRKDERSDCDVTIYDMKNKEETNATLEGYWYLTYNEENRLVVNR